MMELPAFLRRTPKKPDIGLKAPVYVAPQEHKITYNPMNDTYEADGVPIPGHEFTVLKDTNRIVSERMIDHIKARQAQVEKPITEIDDPLEGKEVSFQITDTLADTSELGSDS